MELIALIVITAKAILWICAAVTALVFTLVLLRGN